MRLIALILILIAPTWVFAEEQSIVAVWSCDSWNIQKFNGQQNDDVNRPFFLWQSKQGNYFVRNYMGEETEFKSVLAPDFSAPEFSGFIGYRQYADVYGGLLFLKGNQLVLIRKNTIKYTVCNRF